MGIFGSISKAFKKVGNTIENAVGKVTGKVNDLGEKVIQGGGFFGDQISKATDWLGNAGKDTYKFFKPIGQDIYNTGKGIIQGPANLTNAITDIAKGFGNAANFIPWMLAGLAGLLIINSGNVAKIVRG